MSDDYYEELTTRAMQGEADAVKEMARILEAKENATVVRDTDNRINFRKTADRFNDEYRDVVEDPLAYARVKEIDTYLAHKHPNVDPWARLQSAGDTVRNERDGNQDADQKLAVREIMKHRHRATYTDDGSPEAFVPDEHEREHRDRIAEMALERRKAQGLA